jgi:hypothetical protein
VQIGSRKGLLSYELGIFVVFVEEKWFWVEMASMDSILYFYGAIFHFNK